MGDQSESVAAQMAALREKYAKKLRGRVEEIQSHWETLQADWQPNLVEELHREAHTIAGTGLTFGFKQLGETARQLEHAIQPLSQSEQPPNEAQSQQIVTLISELQQAVEQESKRR